MQEVNSVNEITSDFDMDIYVTELWIDKALRYEDMNPCKYNLSLNNEVKFAICLSFYLLFFSFRIYFGTDLFIQLKY